jgi:hypothetical protein
MDQYFKWTESQDRFARFFDRFLAGFANKQYSMQGLCWKEATECYPFLANFPLLLKIAEIHVIFTFSRIGISKTV